MAEGKWKRTARQTTHSKDHIEDRSNRSKKNK